MVLFGRLFPKTIELTHEPTLTNRVHFMKIGYRNFLYIYRVRQKSVPAIIVHAYVLTIHRDVVIVHSWEYLCNRHSGVMLLALYCANTEIKMQAASVKYTKDKHIFLLISYLYNHADNAMIVSKFTKHFPK